VSDMGFTPVSSDLADLVAIHLQDEEAVLAAALPLVQALKGAFAQPHHEILPAMAERHHAIARVLGDIKNRRQRFRELMARRAQCDVEGITITGLLKNLPTSRREALAACAERIRQMAQEFVAISRWLAIHLRIHLDAYRRLLNDLTGTAHCSGRYGPAGKAEADDVRPLIQILG
jgi:hypothetical protein